MSHIDFLLPMPGGQMMAVGWYDGAAGAEPALRLVLGGGSRRALRHRFHLRDDLPPGHSGFVAIFDTVPGHGETAALSLGERRVALPAAPATGAWADLVARAVDGSFLAVLSEVLCADGATHPLPAGIVQALAPRLRSFGNFAQTPQGAVGFDRFDHCPGMEHGVVAGWALGGDDAGISATLVLLRDEALSVHPVLLNSLLRTDLAEVGRGFAYTGTDGLCAPLHLPRGTGAGSAPFAVLLLRSGQAFLAAAGAGESRQKRVYAARLMELEEYFVPPQTGCSLLPDIVLPRPDAQVRAHLPMPLKPQTHVLLHHNGRDCDLRDVLRHLTRHLKGRISVTLLRDAATPALTRAIDGARSDPGGERLGEIRTAPRPNGAGAGMTATPVLFARSSSLLQMLGWSALPEAMGDCDAEAQVLMEAPLLTPLGDADDTALAHIFRREHPAFVAVFPARILGHPGSAQGSPCLTMEGELRARLMALAEGGRVRFRAEGTSAVFAGRGPDGAEDALAHAFDLALLSRAQQERIAS
ncbi:hypothetical protein [Oceanibium sediminis]|uniref:hypothetical protein n=1 Tax=Oceanibium sediminis TaxID=2026339 RepID=UPI000DD38D9B|nr:hypothetical protein [Oceanibium sediminis]